MDGDAKGTSPIQHAGGADPLDDLGQAFALDVFHGHIAIRARLAGPVDGDQVRMAERHHGLHGPDEALHFFFVLRKLRPKHFQCHLAIALEIVGLEEHARLGLGEQVADVEVRQPFAAQLAEPLGSQHFRLGRRHDGLFLVDVHAVEAKVRVANDNDLAAPTLHSLIFLPLMNVPPLLSRSVT